MPVPVLSGFTVRTEQPRCAAISGLVSSKGYEMNVVFGIGAVFAVIALVCLTLLGRNLVKEHAEKSAGVKDDTAQVSKPQAE